MEICAFSALIYTFLNELYIIKLSRVRKSTFIIVRSVRIFRSIFRDIVRGEFGYVACFGRVVVLIFIHFKVV